MKEDTIICVTILVAILAAFVGGIGVGIDYAQKQAVKLGVACYGSDESGAAKFEYKKCYSNH